MAQKTSALWDELWRTKNTEKEYKFVIDGVEYGPESEVSHSVDSELYGEFGFGNAACAKLTLSLYAENIPRGATIRRFIRLRNGEQVSEWLPKGVFFINRRALDDNYWTIEAYDVMRKADQVWYPDQELEFPLPMDEAVTLFVAMMGTQLDDRTSINHAYTLNYPANDYTIRDELMCIAAAHAGNWIATDDGKLLLAPLMSEPEETNYLVTQYGDAIVIGGVRILVG